MKSLFHFVMMLGATLFFFGCGPEAEDVENYNPFEHVLSRKDWQAQEPKPGLSLHSQHGFEKPVRILVGHFGFTCHDDPIGAMLETQKEKMRQGASDTCYNAALSYPCEKLPKVACLLGRAKESMPAMSKNYNAGSYGVAIIGDTRELEISNEVVQAWGKQFGRIANELGFKELKRGKDGNIVAQCELPNGAKSKPGTNKYPASPSEAFMARFDDMISIANNWLKEHNK